MHKNILSSYLSDTNNISNVIRTIKASNLDTVICFNIDNVVDYIYIKTSMYNVTKMRTRSISNLGTYAYIGLNKKQILKVLLDELSTLQNKIIIFSDKYMIRNEKNIIKIPFIDFMCDKNNYIIVDTNNQLINKLYTTTATTTSFSNCQS
jgi:hypothetical protein